MHTSGRFGTAVLDPAARAGALPLALHPAMTFTGTSVDVQRLAGCSFGVTSPDELRLAAEALVIEMGGEPEWIAESARPLYHAALAIGANHLVTLVAQSMELLHDAGVQAPDRMLGPLLGAALDNALRSGDAALTGPVARGDAGTVAAHIAELREHAPQSVAGYVAMARTTADRALDHGLLKPELAEDLLDVLADHGDGPGPAPGTSAPDTSGPDSDPRGPDVSGPDTPARTPTRPTPPTTAPRKATDDLLAAEPPPGPAREREPSHPAHGRRPPGPDRGRKPPRPPADASHAAHPARPVHTAAALRDLPRSTGARAVVMTMGALHEGHATLVRAARHRVGPKGQVVVTVFVNPLQFGAGEDLDRYPRTLDADVELAAAAGADVVFAPSVDEVYPGGEPQIRIAAGPMGTLLEGASRPGHFDGVLTVVAKLLHLDGAGPRVLRPEGRPAARVHHADGRRPQLSRRDRRRPHGARGRRTRPLQPQPLPLRPGALHRARAVARAVRGPGAAERRPAAALRGRARGGGRGRPSTPAPTTRRASPRSGDRRRGGLAAAARAGATR